MGISVVLGYISLAVNGIIMGMSRGISAIINGDPKTSVGLAIIRFVLLIGAFFILPFLIENIGLWLSFASAELLCLLINSRALKKLSRKWEIRASQ